MFGRAAITLGIGQHSSCIYIDHVYSRDESFVTPFESRMWADAQRDGRPAEYRWRPLPIAAKFGIQENARLGRKVNFARGKIPLSGNSPKNVI